jgi:hypothetical protein
MDEKRLKEINEERDALYNQLNKLDDEAFRIENADALEVAENAIGKFYRSKKGGMGMTSIFSPKKVGGRADINLTLNGEYALETVYLIGDISVYVSNNHPMRIDEFKRDFEEIGEAEYNEKKKRMLEYFMPKENCDGRA